MTTIQVRVVKTRDAATSILRKLGLKPPAYGVFVKQREDQTWEVDLPKVHEQGYAVTSATKALKPAKVKAAKVLKAPKPKAPKAAKAPKVKTERKASCSAVARELILAGKTNAEVWAVIQKQFELGDDKKHYPTWYRCQLKRQGKLTAEK